MSRYDWTAIRAAYENGASLHDLKARFGVDLSHSSTTLRRMGVTMRPKGRPRKSRDELAVMLATQPATRREIASACGVSLRTVSKARAELRRDDRLVEVRW